MSAGLEGAHLVGLPVAVSIGEHGAISLAVCIEDLGVALREEGATADQVAAAEWAIQKRKLGLGIA